MPSIIEFSRCIGTYSSAKFESVIYQYNDNGTIKKMITGGMIITEYTYDADQNITGQKTYVDESKAVKDERLSPEGTIKNLSLGSKVGNSNLIVDNITVHT